MIKLSDLKKQDAKREYICVFDNEFINPEYYLITHKVELTISSPFGRGTGHYGSFFVDNNTSKEIVDAFFPDDYSGAYICELYRDRFNNEKNKYCFVVDGKISFYFDNFEYKTDKDSVTIYILSIYNKDSGPETCILDSKLKATFNNINISEFIPTDIFLHDDNYDSDEKCNRYLVKYDGRKQRTLLMNYKGEVINTINGYKAIKYFCNCKFIAVRDETCSDSSFYIYSLVSNSLVSNDMFTKVENRGDLWLDYSNNLLRYVNEDGTEASDLKCLVNNDGNLVVFKFDDDNILSFEKRIVYKEQKNLNDIKNILFEGKRCSCIIPLTIRIAEMKNGKIYVMCGKDVISRTDIVKYDLMSDGTKTDKYNSVDQIRCFTKDGDVDVLDMRYSKFIKDKYKILRQWSWRYGNLNKEINEFESIDSAFCDKIQW